MKKTFFVLSIALMLISPVTGLSEIIHKEFDYHYRLRTEGQTIGSLKLKSRQLDRQLFQFQSKLIIETSSWGFSYKLKYIEEALLDDKGIVEFNITAVENGKKVSSAGKRRDDQLSITISEEGSKIAAGTLPIKDFETDPFSENYCDFLQKARNSGNQTLRSLDPWEISVNTIVFKNLGHRKISRGGKALLVTIFIKTSSGGDKTEFWVAPDGVTVYFKGKDYEAF